METIVVASQNAIKLNAALTGFQRMFPDRIFEVEGVAVPSEVSEQPMSDQETYQGARNRVNNARLLRPGAHFYVGIEGGVDRHEDEMCAFAWVVIQSHEDQWGCARSGISIAGSRNAFAIPEEW